MTFTVAAGAMAALAAIVVAAAALTIAPAQAQATPQLAAQTKLRAANATSVWRRREARPHLRATTQSPAATLPYPSVLRRQMNPSLMTTFTESIV